MNSAGSTLMFPDRDREYEDYQESLDDEPTTDTQKHSYIGSMAYEKDRLRRRIWEDLGPQATVADWVQACKEQGL